MATSLISKVLSLLLPASTKTKDRMLKESILTICLLAVLTIVTGVSLTRLFSVTQEQQQLQQQTVEHKLERTEPPLSPAPSVETIDETPLDLAPDTLLDLALDTPLDVPDMPIIPFDIGQRMREWIAKKQLADGYFYNPPEAAIRPMKQYSAREITATIPHFTRELLLVTYIASTDEFVVLLPGESSRGPPKCEGGCVRIENIMHAILYAFRNRFPTRFQQGGQDLLFLVSTGDSPRLSRECLDRPGVCKRRRDFGPILHFGSAFRDETILPSLVLMPPPPRIHLRCMADWQIHHEVCEFLLPKRILKNGRETPGIVFGEHVNYNLRDGGIVWEDLIPQVVWRGSDFPYLALLHPEMRPPDYSTDVEPKVKEYGRGGQGIIRAVNDVYDLLRPRWKAVMITAQSEFEANAKNNNPKRKKKVLPWANMKFSSADISNDQWNSQGIPAMGEEMTTEALAKFKYHIDLGGGGGTSLLERNNPGTLEKLALPGLLFHHMSGATDWYHEHLVPWVHYVPVKEDLSDLHQQFEWAEKHERKARSIAKAGTEFVRRMGRPEGMEELYRRHLLKPLENIIESFQPTEEMPADLLGGGDGLTFKEVMRCSGFNIDECPLLH